MEQLNRYSLPYPGKHECQSVCIIHTSRLVNTKIRHNPSYLLVEGLSPCLWRFVDFQMINTFKRSKGERQE